jgi:hypothetical protein
MRDFALSPNSRSTQFVIKDTKISWLANLVLSAIYRIMPFGSARRKYGEIPSHHTRENLKKKRLLFS